MSISISYASMHKTADNLEKTAAKCKEYASALDKKVTRKLDSLTLGASGETNTASYFIRQKKTGLNNRAQELKSYADAVQRVERKARETDQAVSQYIKRECRSFRKSHGMSNGILSGFQEVLSGFVNNLLDKTELGRWIRDRFCDIKDALRSMSEAMRYWYYFMGGKHKLAFLGSIAECVIAAVALVSAAALFIGGTITIGMIAGLVLAVIGMLNAAVNFSGKLKAVMMFSSDPGWAARYSSITTFSDYLHKTNFSSKTLNILSEGGAFIVDAATLICSVITVYSSIKNAADFFGNKYRKNANWKRHFEMTTKDGKFSLRTTIKNWKYNTQGFDYALQDKFLIQKKAALSRHHSDYKSFMKFVKDFKSVETIYKGIKSVVTNYETPKLNLIDSVTEKLKSKTHLNQLEDVYKKGKRMYSTDYTGRRAYSR